MTTEESRSLGNRFVREMEWEEKKPPKSLNWHDLDVMLEYTKTHIENLRSDPEIKTAEDVYHYFDCMMAYMIGLKEGNAT